ncbi:MAG: hypothetical protein VXZ18_17860 [Pseudomonadota bacterium]|nr:hypothetical protein [Pseudomonadota bacterium]
MVGDDGAPPHDMVSDMLQHVIERFKFRDTIQAAEQKLTEYATLVEWALEQAPDDAFRTLLRKKIADLDLQQDDGDDDDDIVISDDDDDDDDDIVISDDDDDNANSISTDDDSSDNSNDDKSKGDDDTSKKGNSPRHGRRRWNSCRYPSMPTPATSVFGDDLPLASTLSTLSAEASGTFPSWTGLCDIRFFNTHVFDPVFTALASKAPITRSPGHAHHQHIDDADDVFNEKPVARMQRRALAPGDDDSSDDERDMSNDDSASSSSSSSSAAAATAVESESDDDDDDLSGDEGDSENEAEACIADCDDDDFHVRQATHPDNVFRRFCVDRSKVMADKGKELREMIFLGLCRLWRGETYRHLYRLTGPSRTMTTPSAMTTPSTMTMTRVGVACRVGLVGAASSLLAAASSSSSQYSRSHRSRPALAASGTSPSTGATDRAAVAASLPRSNKLGANKDSSSTLSTSPRWWAAERTLVARRRCLASSAETTAARRRADIRSSVRRPQLD